jgi:glycosyltransferase involved in cell wall biosynthesis
LKINITYIISNINKALSFEWIIENLDKNKFNLNFVLLNPSNSELEDYLQENKIHFKRIQYQGKKDIPMSILSVYRYLKKNKPDIVHTHLFDANLVGLTAAWLAQVPKRIHTRHHSNYHHQYFPKIVKYDKFVNRISTDIIAISETVKKILTEQENAKLNKVHIIHHGFKLENFINVTDSAIDIISVKLNSSNRHPVVGVISRYIEWKGIQYIIPAFKKFLNDYPKALLILANANGNYKTEINILLNSIPRDSYIEVAFENDIFALYKLFDIFIHVPISPEVEAFGQVYIEALAAGIPSVFTLSGIANEIIKDKFNALVVPYKNSEAIYFAMKTITENAELDKSLKKNSKVGIYPNFNLDKMILSLEHLYEG